MRLQRGDPTTLILGAHNWFASRPCCVDSDQPPVKLVLAWFASAVRQPFGRLASLIRWPARTHQPLIPYAARVSRLTSADSRWRRSSLRALASVVI
jgi:hypothetical protein